MFQLVSNDIRTLYVSMRPGNSRRNAKQERHLIWFFVVFFLPLCHNTIVFAAPNDSCPKPIGQTTNQAITNQYGPYDYRYNKGKELQLVESAHFTPEVASLMAGKSGMLDADIDYTLRAFPNHHRALLSLAELAVREHATKLPHMNFSVPCFFIRGIHWAPNDPMINALYAYYLSRIHQNDLAIAQIKEAISKNPDSPRTAYTLGLAYYYLEDYTKAREYSNKAKKLGSAAVGLDHLLSQVGR